MKNTLPNRSIVKVLIVLLMGVFVPKQECEARAGAYARSTGSGSFGAYGLSWNWGSVSSAVNAAISAARNSNGGYLNGYQYNWWTYRGWEAGARGYNYDGSYVYFGWAYGWGTSSSALNTALNRLYGNRYSLSYRTGYNY